MALALGPPKVSIHQATGSHVGEEPSTKREAGEEPGSAAVITSYGPAEMSADKSSYGRGPNLGEGYTAL